MKNNLEYYSHYANSDQHPKFKTLRVKYGWQGEGRFWALNNRIAISENCKLDLSKERNRAALASDLGLSLVKFDEYILFLSSEACALLTNLGDNLFTTDTLQENLVKVSGIRNDGKDRQQRFRDRIDQSNAEKKGSNAVTQPQNEHHNGVTDQQSKVKESKEKETKVNTSDEVVENEFLDLRELEQYLLQAWGREGRVGKYVLDEFIDLGRKHGKDKLFEAILTAAKASAKSYRYVKAILENNKPKPVTGSRPVSQSDIRKTHIAFFCECGHHSAELNKTDLENNIGKFITCPSSVCKKRYSVKEILDKAGDSGRADFQRVEETA